VFRNAGYVWSAEIDYKLLSKGKDYGSKIKNDEDRQAASAVL